MQEEIYNTVPMMASRFHLSHDVLYHWRLRGEGPKAVKVAGKLLYPESGVQEWLRTLEADQVVDA